jgi:DHA1 family multidrug resistance protein-like MFS transporter
MLDLIREAPLGQAIRLISQNRLLQYLEEKPDFVLPIQYALQLKQNEKSITKDTESASPHGAIYPLAESDAPRQPGSLRHTEDDLEALGEVRTRSSIRTAPYSNERAQVERELDLERMKSIPIIPQKTSDGIILVDWYTTDDPANPQNWSSIKKGLIVCILCIYTWTVYCAGPFMLPPKTKLCNTSESVQLLLLSAYRYTYLHTALGTFSFLL